MLIDAGFAALYGISMCSDMFCTDIPECGSSPYCKHPKFCRATQHLLLTFIGFIAADRLLLQRLRKSQSGTALYGDAQQQVVEDYTEPSVYSAYEGTTSQRLIVVANRLPVSAVRERDGSWSLQVYQTGTSSKPLNYA